MGFFQSLFGKKSEPLADYSLLGVDMHSHLLPGLDDGAPDLDASLNLIRSLSEMGLRKFYCTPHVMSDFYKNDATSIMPALDLVRAAVKEHGIPVDIHAAAEYYVDDGFVRKLEAEKLLTFGDNMLLFEVSYINAPENIDHVIFRIQVLGYKPVMAHPERYPFWYRDFSRYQSFRDQGVLLQVNLNSLTGYYGPEARQIANRLADENMIDLLGTDCHHERHLEGIRKGLKEPVVKRLLESGRLMNHLL